MIEVTLKGNEAEHYLTFRKDIRSAMVKVLDAVEYLKRTTPSNLSLSASHWGARGGVERAVEDLLALLENQNDTNR